MALPLNRSLLFPKPPFSEHRQAAAKPVVLAQLRTAPDYQLRHLLEHYALQYV